jgi:UDP-N-acetylmuramyl pentapeptide synthase
MNTQIQKAFSWDKTTVIKTLKGGLIALGAPFALLLLEVLGQVQISNTTLAMFMAWFLPVAINAIKEWAKETKV